MGSSSSTVNYYEIYVYCVRLAITPLGYLNKRYGLDAIHSEARNRCTSTKMYPDELKTFW